MMEYQNVPVAICFNKTDLVTEEELHAFADIYAACGYRTLFASAKEEKGVDALLELLKGKTAAGGRNHQGSWQIFSCEPPAAEHHHADRGSQPQDRARKTYHTSF